MRSGEVVVEPMWAFHVVALQRKGFPVRYAAPPEGFRGWSVGLAISSEITDPARLQAAYDYINWWHAGYAGAVMMRVGYYHAVQATSRRFVDPAEWDYWIGGKPAAKDLPGVFGDITIRKGQARDGGSFVRRVCRYASWNSIFREHVPTRNGAGETSSRRRAFTPLGARRSLARRSRAQARICPDCRRRRPGRRRDPFRL